MIFLRVFLSFDKFQRSKLQVPMFEIEQIESLETSNLKHHRDEDLSMSLFLLHVWAGTQSNFETSLHSYVTGCFRIKTVLKHRAFADSLTREESRQQFYDKVVYLFLHERQAKMLVKNTTMPFLKRGTVLKEKVDFILSKLNIFENSSFYIIWNTAIDKTDYSWVQLDTNSIFDIHGE